MPSSSGKARSTFDVRVARKSCCRVALSALRGTTSDRSTRTLAKNRSSRQSAKRSKNSASMVLTGTMRILESIRGGCFDPSAGYSAMIVGIGIDLAEVERYRFDESKLAWFARKIYTEVEVRYAMRKRNWPERLAGFFAAKEATRKAFGHAIPWRWVGVAHER